MPFRGTETGCKQPDPYLPRSPGTARNNPEQRAELAGGGEAQLCPPHLPLGEAQGKPCPMGADNKLLRAQTLTCVVPPSPRLHSDFLPGGIPKQPGTPNAVPGWQTPSHPPSALRSAGSPPLYLLSHHAALQPELTGSPASHWQCCAWREAGESSAQLAGSARARLAASVPPPPSASPGASFPWAPWGWARLRCSVGAKNPAQSKHNNPVRSKHSVSVKPAGPCLRQRSCCRHRLYGGSG